MSRLSFLWWRRTFYVALLVVIGTVMLLTVPPSPASAFLILISAMLLSGVGLGLGSHLVIRDGVPPTVGRLIGGALAGGLAGALLFVAGFVVGVSLANLFRLPPTEGAEWGLIFLPIWIFFSGGSAICARYLAWRFLGNQIVVAIAAGVVGALVGDALMTLTIFRPFAVGPNYLHAPLAMTSIFGALVAAGLAWAERKVPHKNADADNAPLANDTKRP